MTCLYCCWVACAISIRRVRTVGSVILLILIDGVNICWLVVGEDDVEALISRRYDSCCVRVVIWMVGGERGAEIVC